jgi:uncharacterized protein YdeI (YjbR/CyaY-like superfamily)
MRTATPPKRFASPEAFRAWLARHHASATELGVRCYKVGHADKGMTYKQAVDEALCFGWIDGVTHRCDAESFEVRFSPRRPRSIWSRVNIAKVQALIAAGRMMRAGLAAFEARHASRSGVYAFEQEAVELDAAAVRTFKRQRAAWAYFQARPPWYRRTTTHWVMSAKRKETRQTRLETLIDCCERQTTLPQLTRKP